MSTRGFWPWVRALFFANRRTHRLGRWLAISPTLRRLA